MRKSWRRVNEIYQPTASHTSAHFQNIACNHTALLIRKITLFILWACGSQQTLTPSQACKLAWALKPKGIKSNSNYIAHFGGKSEKQQALLLVCGSAYTCVHVCWLPILHALTSMSLSQRRENLAWLNWHSPLLYSLPSSLIISSGPLITICDFFF